MLGGVRASHVPPRRRSYSALRLPRRMPAQTLVSLVFGLRCPHRAHGYPRLLGHLLRTRRVPRPRRVHLHPVPSGDGWCRGLQGHGTPWTLGIVPFSRLTSHGSFVCVPTHRRARCRPASALSPSCPSQGSLPTRLAGLIGRDSHPLDDASVFLEGHRTSFPYGPALPGRTPDGTSCAPTWAAPAKIVSHVVRVTRHCAHVGGSHERRQCRVAPAVADRGPPRSGRGDFHHPALLSGRLTVVARSAL